MIGKLYKLLSRPYIVVLVMAIAPILAIADRNFGYFFGLFIALFLLWQSGWDWTKFGFGQRVSLGTVLRGLMYAVGIFLVVNVGIEPFLEIFLGKIDLSSIEEIRGDFSSFFVLFLIMWVFAAFGEERNVSTKMRQRKHHIRDYRVAPAAGSPGETQGRLAG